MRGYDGRFLLIALLTKKNPPHLKALCSMRRNDLIMREKYYDAYSDFSAVMEAAFVAVLITKVIL